MYKITRFDKKEAIKTVLIYVAISLSLTLLNPILSAAPWVKEGENFILFFPVLVGILLYGFSVSTVFQAGQDAWNKLLEEVEDGNEKKVKVLMERAPDIFPTLLAILGWALLVTCSMLLQIPSQLLWLMFILHLVMILPIALALDYWGYDSGIKHIKQE